MKQATRTVILSCSGRKRPDPGLIPALERYDDNNWRILRKYLREHEDTGLAVWAFSSSYGLGLYPASNPIPNYDLPPNPISAAALYPWTIATLREIKAQGGPVLAVVGQTYRTSIAAAARAIGLDVTFAEGGPGYKGQTLKRWLEEGAPR